MWAGGIGARRVIFVDSCLAVVDQVEWFPGRDMRLPIDIVLQKGWLESAVVLGVRDIINVLCSLAVLGDDGGTRFLALAGQRILRGMLQQTGVEDRMDFHGLGKAELDNQRIGEYSFDWVRSHIAIIELHNWASGVQVLGVKPHHISYKVTGTRATSFISRGFIDGLGN